MDAALTDVLQSEVAALQATFPALAPGLEKACAILREQRLFMEESGREAMVQSSDGTQWYAVNGHCTCKAAQYHDTPCAHRLAVRLYQRVCDALVTAEERWTVAVEQDSPRSAPVIVPPQYLTHLHGKPFVQYAGLLALAHAHGLVSLKARLVSVTADLAVAEAEATFQDGRLFVEAADATPGNVGPQVKTHFARLALTRAKARALRDALNIGVTFPA